MYRQAEMEAQKCKVLERKIQDLKHAKVNLARKQKEDAAKHREITSMDCNCSMAAILALPAPSRSCHPVRLHPLHSLLCLLQQEGPPAS